MRLAVMQRCSAREEKVALRPSATIARGQQVVAF
jgi:hypothetical protein